MTAEKSPEQPAKRGACALQRLLQVIFVVAIITFFLPNVTISLDIIGNQSLSMLGLLIAEANQAEQGNFSSGQYYFHSISAPNFWEDIVQRRDGLGGIVCATSLLLLMFHYLLNIVWGFFTFGLRQTHRLLTFLWLFSAAQYPVFFSIGAYGILDTMKSHFGEPLVANLKLQPGLATWLLMLLSWLALLLLFNPFSPRPTMSHHGQIDKAS